MVVPGSSRHEPDLPVSPLDATCGRIDRVARSVIQTGRVTGEKTGLSADLGSDMNELIASWQRAAQHDGDRADSARSQRRQPSRRRARWLVAAVGTALAIALAVLGASAGERSSGPDWVEVVAAADRARVAAWAGDPTALTRHFAGAALARERSIARTLIDRGLTVDGWSSELLVVEVQESAAVQVELTVTDRRGGYRLVNRAGRVEETVQAAGLRRWFLDLQREQGEWLIVGVRSADPEGSALGQRGP